MPVRAPILTAGRMLPPASLAILCLLTATAATSQEIPDGQFSNDQTQNNPISAETVNESRIASTDTTVVSVCPVPIGRPFSAREPPAPP